MIEKNVLWMTIAYCVCMLLNTASSVLVPRLLGPKQFGEFTMVLWIAGWIAIFSQVGLPDAVRKYVADLHSLGNVAEARKLVARLATLQCALTTLGCVVMLTVASCFIHDPFTKRLAVIAAFAAPPSTIAAIFANALNGKELIHITSKMAGACGVVTIMCNLIVLLCGGGAVGLLSVTLTANLVYFAVMFGAYRRHLPRATDPETIHPFPNRGPRKSIFSYCVGVTFAGVCFAVALDKSELFFLKLYGGVGAVAMYAIAFNIAQKVLQIPSAWGGILIPAFAKRASRGDTEAMLQLYRFSTRSYFLLIAPFSFLIGSQASLIMKLLYGSQYAPAATACAIAMLTVPAASFTVPAMSVIYATTGVTRVAILCMFIPVSVDLVLSATIIPHWGVTGAAMANLITQWTMAFCITQYVLRSNRFSFKLGYFAKILAIAATSAAVSAAISWSFGQRAGIIGLLFGSTACLILLKAMRIFAEPEFQGLSDNISKLPRPFRFVLLPALHWLQISHTNATANCEPVTDSVPPQAVDLIPTNNLGPVEECEKTHALAN